jgi:3-hydroxyacyl-CoA dehydrogenase
MSRQIRSIVVVGVGDTSARIAAALTAAGVEVSTVPADGDFADPAAGLAAADLVVEAGSEPVAARRDLLRRIDAAVGERAIVATTATAATVTELAVSTSAPHRVVGLRFALPPERPLVELTAPVVSSPETVEAVTALLVV